jgi:hypothetical protein
MAKWMKEGSFEIKKDIAKGLEKFPDVLNMLLDRRYFGRLILKSRATSSRRRIKKKALRLQRLLTWQDLKAISCEPRACTRWYAYRFR